MKKISSLLIFYFFVNISAQIKVPLNYNGSNTDLENIILHQNNEAKDYVKMESFLTPLNKHKDPKLHAIYFVLLADSYSSYFDRPNTKSLQYFEKANKIATGLGNESLNIWTTTRFASYLYKYRDYKKLIPALLELINATQKVSPEKMVLPYETYRFIGWNLSTFKDHKEALQYFEKAKKLVKTGSKNEADIFCYIGTSYLELNDTKNARYNFLKSIDIAKKTNYRSRLAKSIGFLAQMELNNGNKTKAIELFEQDIAISEMAQDDQNTMYALIQLSKIELLEEKLEIATKHLNKAKDIAKSKSYFESSEREILALELQILEKNTGADDELEIRRRLQVLDDSLKYKDGELQLNLARWSIQKAKYDRELSKTNSKTKFQELVQNLAVVLVVVLLIISIFIYGNYRKKLAQKSSFYQQKINDIESKSQHISALNQQLEQIKHGEKSSASSENLEKLLQSHLMTDENWFNFKKAFKNEHPNTFSELTSYPELTEANLRIVLLQKLGYQNTQIAGLLGITTEAVKKSKQRLKKKLGSKYEELTLVIS